MTADPVRYGAIYLAIGTILRENIPGDLAEAGVYQGHASRMIHSFAPERTLFLFDTFAGFPENDLDGKADRRFKNTNLDVVKRNIGDLQNIIFCQGYFPTTTQGLEDHRFAFVMLDLDLYNPTLAGMKFFYPRLSPGGYLFVHDFNSPESDWAVSKVVREYMQDKPEKLIEIPDLGGSVIIRRCTEA